MKETDLDQNSIVLYLSNLASKQYLIERAMRGCDKWFENEEYGLIGGWSRKDFVKEFFTFSLTFKRASWDLVYIDTTLNLLDKDGQEIGYYRLITTLDGEVDDDYLIFHKDSAR
jgi:hypothetical protein